MSTSANDQAFPLDSRSNAGPIQGLTKREYFAAMALQGVIAGDSNHNFLKDQQYPAEHAVGLADALIAALNK
jgi:hypothetical protein